MKELLIIRSVSFQQLDKNLVAIKALYPEHRISILTHEHGVLLAEKYKDIDRVYVYPYKEGFKWGNQVNSLKGKTFDSVVIPVTNLTGAGFFNVLLFSLSIRAKERIVCNVISEMRAVKPGAIHRLGLMNGIISILSMIVTAIAAIPVALFLPVQLFKMQRKGSEK